MRNLSNYQRFERVLDALPINARPEGVIELQVGQFDPPEIGRHGGARPEGENLGGASCVTQKATLHKDRPQNQRQFAAETAVITGESKSQVNRHLAIADALGEDLDKVTGTKLPPPSRYWPDIFKVRFLKSLRKHWLVVTNLGKQKGNNMETETVPRSQNHLAELLGISKGAASKQASRGMPTHTLEAATAWRKKHINPAAIKGSRFDQFYKPTPSRKLAEPEQAAPEPDWFQLAAVVLELADDLLQANQSIDCIIPKIRAAMACMPLNERPVLPLPLNVIELLVADVMALLPPDDGSPVWCNGDDLSETEADELGAFWYQVAAGEVTVS